MFPGQGLQQPLHFGLEFHNRLAVAWVFLWSRQKVEKEKGIVIVCLARRWGGHLPRAWTRESWGSAEAVVIQGKKGVYRIVLRGCKDCMVTCEVDGL